MPHLLIAGTGRAGTSFLVRYLTALGLDTHISRHGDSQWDDTAQAGLEDLPFGHPPGTLPYVLKSPWLAECIDAVLALPDFTVDAVIIPMRDLAEAATSRMVVQRQAIQREAPWLAENGLAWSTWGAAPGGAVYSLHPLDQARILAAGFHHLVQRLTAADIPVILLDFPRLATDAGYLFRKLQPCLPPGIAEEVARAAHAALADPGKLRVGTELGQAMEHESLEAEAIALRRSLARREAAVREAQAQAWEGARQAQAQAEAATQAFRSATAAQDAARRLQQEAEAAQARHAAELAALRASLSWRLTAPLRAAARLLRGAAR
jgi:hypothetical protein